MSKAPTGWPRASIKPLTRVRWKLGRTRGGEPILSSVELVAIAKTERGWNCADIKGLSVGEVPDDLLAPVVDTWMQRARLRVLLADLCEISPEATDDGVIWRRRSPDCWALESRGICVHFFWDEEGLPRGGARPWRVRALEGVNDSLEALRICLFHMSKRRGKDLAANYALH